MADQATIRVQLMKRSEIPPLFEVALCGSTPPPPFPCGPGLLVQGANASITQMLNMAVPPGVVSGDLLLTGTRMGGPRIVGGQPVLEPFVFVVTSVAAAGAPVPTPPPTPTPTPTPEVTAPAGPKGVVLLGLVRRSGNNYAFLAGECDGAQCPAELRPVSDAARFQLEGWARLFERGDQVPVIVRGVFRGAKSGIFNVIEAQLATSVLGQPVTLTGTLMRSGTTFVLASPMFGPVTTPSIMTVTLTPACPALSSALTQVGMGRVTVSGVMISLNTTNRTAGLAVNAIMDASGRVFRC